MREYISRLKNALEQIEDRICEFANLQNEIIKRIKNDGKIYIVSAGQMNKIVDSIVNSLDYLFKFEKNKIISIEAAIKYKNILPNSWKHFENNKTIGAIDAIEYNITKNDLIIAISSTGKTHYINNFLTQCKTLGAQTYNLTSANDSNSVDYKFNNINIELDKTIGGLYIGNHTTILKVIIESLIFDSFTKLGQIYEGRILTTYVWTKKLFTTSFINLKHFKNDITEDEAKELLIKCDNQLSVAILTITNNVDPIEAKELLEKNKYNFKKIFEK